ncbi:hypothetical protein GOP47_0028694 [Adiantum capillus-veneris]|nr:hypothetical protein GOP47_0028694 [Adiantum capillus-veneris]
MRACGINSLQVISKKVVPGNDCFWDVLVTAYAKGGDARWALDIYQRMQQSTTQWSSYTYITLFKACAKLKDVVTGSRLHEKVKKIGLLESNPYVGTALLDMYATCGMFIEAKTLLNQLVDDTVSWNALISAYVRQERSEEALACVQLMHSKSVLPNDFTISSALKACGSLQAIYKGKQIHSQIIRSGLLDVNQVVGNALVDMYMKCGVLSRAEEVFDNLPAHNVATWNTIISGFVEEECCKGALKAFEQMKSEGIPPNEVTFTSILKVCGSLKLLEKGKYLHCELSKTRLLGTEQIVGNALVGMYAKCGQLGKAQEVFDSLQNHDVVSWSTLISGYVQQELGREALLNYDLMQRQGVLPNEVTYVCILKACGSTQAKVKGQEIHAELDKKGIYKASQLVGNVLINMYSKFGLMAKAQEVFDTIPVRNLVSWNTLIFGYVQNECGEEAFSCFEQMRSRSIHPNEVTYACVFKACGLTREIDKGRELHAEADDRRLLARNILVGNALIDMYIKCGRLREAQELFDKSLHHDTVSWNTLIAGYLEEEHAEEALSLSESMWSQGVVEDDGTLTCCLKACGIIGAAEKGKIWHCRAEQAGLLKTNQLVGNALVDMYVKCGMLAKAQKAFDLLPMRDIISWTTLITGYAQLGEDAAVVASFEKMRGEGVIPNSVTFLSVLTACSHCGLIDKGHSYFRAMSEEYNLTPALEHHICMVDILSRAGQLERAVAYTREPLHHRNIMMWLTVLGACRKWQNVDLGKHAFEQVLLLDDQESSAYLCMYNIYIDAAMHAHAKEVESLKMRLSIC